MSTSRLRKDKRQNRREEAIIRQEEYSKLSNEQKVAKLDKFGYKAVKQRKRLLWGIV